MVLSIFMCNCRSSAKDGGGYQGRQRRSRLCTLTVAFLFVLLSTLATTTASASMFFQPQNVQQPSLYQTALMTLTSNTNLGSPKITTGDVVYPVLRNSASTDCVFDTTGKTTFTVTATNAQGFAGRVQLIITADVFTLNDEYVLCYISATAKSATVMARNDNFSNALLIRSQLYNAFATIPTASIHGGEGPASLSVTASQTASQPPNQGLVGANTIYMVPCAVSSDVTCKDLNALTRSCAIVGEALATGGGGLASSAVLLSSLVTEGSTTTGLFIAPYISGAPADYFICVPYCFSQSGGSVCTAASSAAAGIISSSLLVPATTTTPNTVTFLPASPPVYTVSPAQPQAMELGYLHFAAEGLSLKDQVKVIQASDECTSSTASLLANLQIGTLEEDEAGGSDSDSGVVALRLGFTYTIWVSAPVVGKVCYLRSASGLWSSVFQTPTPPSSGADFVIDVLQPTSFTVTPTAPSLGEAISLHFTGTGLNSAEDTAYLTTVPISLDPCGADPSTTESGSSTKFDCVMKSGGPAPVCEAVVDPANINQATTLTVCYQKSGTLSYALVKGEVNLGARNPTYAIDTYPFYAGQTVAITFYGTNMGTTDVVKLLPNGGICSDDAPVSPLATLGAVKVISSGVAYQYPLVGAGEACLTVCYYLASSKRWTVARPQADTSGTPPPSPTCSAADLYITPYPIRYKFNALAASESPTAMETITVRLSAAADAGSGVANLLAGQESMKVVRVADVSPAANCVLSFCNGVAACKLAQSTSDYVGQLSTSGTGVTAISAAAAMLSESSSGQGGYVVCVLNNAVGGGYIPVLSGTPDGPHGDDELYGFSVVAQNPTLASLTPSTWRVALATLGSTFTGTHLSPTSDVVYAVSTSSLLNNANACSLPGSSGSYPGVILNSAIDTAASTATLMLVSYTRSALLKPGSKVHLCYAWGGSDTASPLRVTYTGAATLAEAIPTTMTGVPTTGYRAGVPVSLQFIASKTSGGTLSAAQDKVYFYLFPASTRPPACYCNPGDCAGGTRISFDSLGATLTQDGAMQTNYYNVIGFQNFGVDAQYVVCYHASTIKRSDDIQMDTFMGNINVGLANPAYYTLRSVAGNINRVGAPLSVSAVRLFATLDPLTDSDVMLLVPEAKQCADITGGSEVSDVVQLIGPPVVTSSLYTQVFVVDAVGNYRVCYRMANSATFNELVFSPSFWRLPIAVVVANPSSAVSYPAAVPSAGQFITIDITCGTTLCATCATLRLILGSRQSCWEDNAIAAKKVEFESDDCLETTRIQFPDQDIPAGEYTVCYGASLTTARRIPSTIKVAPANPSTYAVAASVGTNIIYTNQATPFTIDINGVGLKVTDQPFLMPEKGFNCHDLRTGAIQGNGTYAKWFAPSINGNPLVVQGTAGVTWVVSDDTHRFDVGMLYDAQLCGTGDGSPCDMKLCYLREGTTWGPVPLSSTATGPIQVAASNPSAVEFDQYPFYINFYVMATVAGTNLLSTDTLVIHEGSCAGEQLSVSVQAAVNTAADKWIGVLRIIGSRGLGGYAVCYWRGGTSTGTPTEIVELFFPDATVTTLLILDSQLYYVPDSALFASAQYTPAQYEEMVVRASFYANGEVSVPLSEVQLINGARDTAVTPPAALVECNYEPFYAAVGSSATRFPVEIDFELRPTSGASPAMWQGRLAIASGDVALCMLDTTGGLFRVVAPPPDAAARRRLMMRSQRNASVGTADKEAVMNSGLAASAETLIGFPVLPANPANYISTPVTPMYGQAVTIVFEVSTSSGSVPLEVGSNVQVIAGTLFECGFNNATAVIAEGTTVASAEGAPAGSVSVHLQLPTDEEVVAAGVTNPYVGMTICYRKPSSTYATVPRDTKADQNLFISPQVPESWSQLPTQAQVGLPVALTFYGDANQPDFLTTEDTAFLVTQPTTRAFASASASAETNLCATAAPVLSSTSLTKDGPNTVWSIAAGLLEEGTYLVCYTAVANGSPIYVTPPAIFTVYPIQSPYGAYTNMGGLDVRRGNRFFLFFESHVPLTPILNNGAQSENELKGKDAVRLTSSTNCTDEAAALTKADVEEIPADFQYKEPTDPAPHLNLRIRAPVGKYYICMRRADRESWQAFYNYDLVGGPVNPAALEVKDAPVSSFTTAPASPRAWVPMTAVTVQLSGTFVITDFTQLFFVPYKGASSSEAGSEIQYDGCYRPDASQAINPEIDILLDTTMQVSIGATLTAELPFSSKGRYLLCYQLAPNTEKNSVFPASVFPSAVSVMDASPIFYTVPETVSTTISFPMAFTAIDAIFANSVIDNNAAQIYEYTGTNLEEVPTCTGVSPPVGGFTTFTKFTPGADAEHASVDPMIVTQGFYYVCFLTYDQLQYFPVPNLMGGYIFSVGLTGPHEYTVTPVPAYAGQELDLAISGSQLTSADHVKIVDVTGMPTTEYPDACTATAQNADALAPGTAGSTVPGGTSVLVHYKPRVIISGTFVLCYQSVPLGNTWAYVANVPFFTVGAAHPTQYKLLPDPSYETESTRLVILDTNNLLEPPGKVKLVQSGSVGKFDCTSAAPPSPDVAILTYIPDESSGSVAVYRLCGTAATSVTVCYMLDSSPSWAEVPTGVDASGNYTYAPLVLNESPFSDMKIAPMVGSSPRSYEIFTLSLDSSDAAVRVTNIRFSTPPLEVCAADVQYVTPVLDQATPAVSNNFTLSLALKGQYVLHLQTRAAADSPSITYSQLLTIQGCDPCSVIPTYAFIGGSAMLTFPSATGDSLREGDQLRLVPASVGVSGHDVCAMQASGPYPDSFTPTTVGAGGASTTFTIPTGTTAEQAEYLGNYLLCYKKAATQGNFAVVSDDGGEVATFSIYPDDVLTSGGCPDGNDIFALETVEYAVSMRDPELYPSASFSPLDEFVLVPSEFLPGGDCGLVKSIEQIVVDSEHQAVVPEFTGIIADGNISTWAATYPRLPSSITTGIQNFFRCFKLEYDTVFRNIAPTPGSITPTDRVRRENPVGFTTEPQMVQPTSPTVTITITGSGLSAADNVYIVPDGESCAETCSNRPLIPKQWDGTPHTTDFVNANTVEVLFNSPINVEVVLGVCYRRNGQLLTLLGTFYVGEQNPISYVADFVPREGTRPTLTFTGTRLTATDTVMIVLPTNRCQLSNALATGEFRNVNVGATETAFYLPLVGVMDGTYTVCYRVSTAAGFVEVPPPLQVLPGGPTGFATTNTPMVGRATEVSFPTTTASVYSIQVGDEAFIACVGCSCFDTGVEAKLPYGTPHGTVTPETLKTFALRVGFGTTENYPVCFKVIDSGFAQVGSVLHFITAVPSSPAVSAVAPDPTYQGQRVAATFNEFSTEIPVGALDSAMVVRETRLCWETEVADPNNILSTVAQIEMPTETEAVLHAHVPSLGPDALPLDQFPLQYVLCYRQAGQSEFLAVPYPVTTGDTMQPASPSRFTSNPTEIERGMTDVTIYFFDGSSGSTVISEEGDVAYAVQFRTLTNTVCTDSSSVRISAEATAYPTYAFSVPGDALIGTSNTAFCYIRSGATVAEVPQLVTIVEGNPSGYTTNIPASPGEGRERQYIEFDVLGVDLNVETDDIAFTTVPCARALETLVGSASGQEASTPYLARLGDRTVNTEGTIVSFVAQFVAPTSPISLFLCYKRGGYWLEVGASLTLAAPQPSAAVLRSVGDSTTLRAGQGIFVELLDADLSSEPTQTAVLRGDATGAGTWCNNYTQSDIREPLLQVTNPGLLTVAIWQYPGKARLCVRTADNPIADVGATVEEATLTEVLPANPAWMIPFPKPPRVGQSVTLTFHLIVTASVDDLVKIVDPSDPLSANEPCDIASGAPEFPDDLPVTVINATTTSVTPVDVTDPFLYRSFDHVGDYRVCYFTAAEKAWGVVGGTLAAGTVEVEEMVPQSWELAPGYGQPTLGVPFAIQFSDALGNLDPVAGHDLAWAVPSRDSCGVDPFDNCPQCIIFDFDTQASTPNLAVTRPNISLIVGEMNLCYRLADATASLVPGQLVIQNGPIQCFDPATVVVGQTQQVTFRKDAGESVTGDSWRVSFYATSATSCSDRYVPDFVAAMAKQTEVTSTTVVYTLEWPVSMTEKRYTICYTHNDRVASICSCGQIDSLSGLCFVSTTPGSPNHFSASPNPTYVGQTIQVTLSVPPSLVAHPPTAVKFVKYVNELTTCADDAAFPPPAGATLVPISPLEYVYTFKHNYADGSAELLVCALTNLSPVYARVGNQDEGNLLWIRPYFTLSTFPSDATYVAAMQTLNLTFTLQSQLPDDVLSVNDRITFVSDPDECIESYINVQPPASVLALFELDDTAFSQIPAPLSSIDQATFTAKTTATFATAGVGQRVVCYRLVGGTWAPVLPELDVQPALATSCDLQLPTSPANGGDGGAQYRAMQYIRTTITGTPTMAQQWSNSDLIRVVPQSSPCTNDAVSVFSTYTILTTSPSSGEAEVSTIAFTPSNGVFKVCYRFGVGTTNWSPTCQSVTVTTASPVGGFEGCLNQRQALDVAALQQSGFIFSATDTFRFVAGNNNGYCLLPGGSAAAPLPTVAVNDADQPVAGVPVGSAAAGTSHFDVPYALLGEGTKSIRLCYTDAAGNQFAVPFNYDTDRLQSTFAVQSSQPGTMFYTDGESSSETSVQVQMGERILMNFTAAAAGVTPTLVPYGIVVNPYIPGPIFDGTFDAAAMLAIGTAGPTSYRDGRCEAASRASAAAFTLRGVYGPTLTGNVPYTVAGGDPTVSGDYHIACYRLAKCGVADSGAPVLVNPYNPASTSTTVPSPRHGQLFNVVYVRDPSQTAFTPGADRGAKVPNLAACWELNDGVPAAGEIVKGNTDQTYFTAFFPAEAPAQATNTNTRTCYMLNGHASWTEIPNNVGLVLAANPHSFVTTPALARQYQRNTLTLRGTGLGASDTVKIIAPSLNCSDDAVPPAGVLAYNAQGQPQVGTSAGWTVTSVDTSTRLSASINFSAEKKGEYSVCYKLASDTVWTLVYSNLVVGDRNPASVDINATYEGELFSTVFTAAKDATESGATDGLTENDRIGAYLGENVDCMNPAGAVELETVKSASDLPYNITFQLSGPTRGRYTMCYMRAINAAAGDFLPVWGFPSILVGPNPQAVAVYPGTQAARTPHRLLSLVFDGWALVAGPTKTDIVKLIDSTAYEKTDEACREAPLATGVNLSPSQLSANGTYSVQTWTQLTAAEAPDTPLRYWICYKLAGGQFHVIGDELRVSSEQPSPSGATPSQSVDPMYIGETVQWTLQGNSACGKGDVLFYSAQDCADVPYYVTGALPVEDTEYFKMGGAEVDCSAKSTSLRATEAAAPVAAKNEKLSLCYYRVSGGSGTTVLLENSIAVQVGVPPPLDAPIHAPARQIFDFKLSVVPTTEDYVVLVTDPDDCTGVKAPADAALFIQMTFNEASSAVVVTTAVPAAGLYFICYSHQAGVCAPGTGRNCARVVGQVVATSGQPEAWSSSPAELYTTASAAVTFQFTDGASAAAQSTAQVWMAALSGDATEVNSVMYEDAADAGGPAAMATQATMQQVAKACLTQSATSPGSIALSYDATAKDWKTGQLLEVAEYALCYRPNGGAITIFAPSSNAGPVVQASVVTQVAMPSSADLNTKVQAVFSGGGLSQTDTATAVAVPSAALASGSKNGIPEDICTNAAYKPRVTAAPSTEGYGLTVITRQFTFSDEGTYAICYKTFVSSSSAATLVTQDTIRAVKGGGGGGGGHKGWSSADLALLIVGVVFLFILLVLLVILFWRLCCVGGGVAGGKREKVVTSVYMPPRANDRFIYTSAPIAIQQQQQQQPLLALPPTPQPQVATTSAGATNVRINIHDTAAAAAAPPVAQQSVFSSTPTVVVPPGPALPPPQGSASAAGAAVSSIGTTSDGDPVHYRSKRSHGKKRHNKRHQSSSSDGLRSTDREDVYADLDREEEDEAEARQAMRNIPQLPPLPPPPVPAVSPATGVAHISPTVPAAQPSAALQVPSVALAPVQAAAAAPQPPVPLSGPYQHLHHPNTTGSSSSSTTTATNTTRNTLLEPGLGDGTGALGPFVIAGHTSRPMVRTRSKTKTPNEQQQQ